jgi:hypothetical protein
MKSVWKPVSSIGSAATWRAWASLGWAALAVAAVLGTGVLAAGCGGSSGQDVASLGTTTTTSTNAAPAAVPSGSRSNPADTAFAFVGCMRTHGEPNMPEPDISKNGGHTKVKINASSGIDPNSPLLTSAYKACKHLLPSNGGPSKGNTMTPADRADYLKATACMRSHDVPDFPDPTFQNGGVSFNSRTPIDTNAPRYRSALTTCQKLIPAGLPYGSSSGP